MARPIDGKLGASLGPRDAVCVLTHDNKFDVPAITSALQTQVGYIGVMGVEKLMTIEPKDSLKQESQRKNSKESCHQ